MRLVTKTYILRFSGFVDLLVIYIFLMQTSYAQSTDTIKKPTPFAIHGNINVNLIGYYVSGIPYRSDPFSAVLSANVSAKFYNIELPISFIISNRQESYAQPFNQFGISPRWKWITLHGGYRNVTFSPFTLGGHTFFGAGIELSPGIFRFGFIYGRFDRKTTENPVYKTNALPNFARKGYAIKLGVGTEKNFFDLILLRIHDDSSSISQIDTGTIRTPEQNVVLGANSRFTFFKKLIWETEAAFSLFTTDLWAEPISDIEENSLLRSMNNFFGINQSSEYYYAIRSSLGWKSRNWSLKLEYRRIEPNYRSMGAYFFNNDIQNITLTPSFRLFKRKLVVSGSVGLQNDNLRKTKKVTSSRTIGSASISINPSSKYGLDLLYSNYSISQKSGRMTLNDTTKVQQANHNFSFMPRVMFISMKRSHMIMLIYNLAMLSDKNQFTDTITNFKVQTAQLNYIFGLLQSRWSFTFGAMYLQTDNYLGSTGTVSGNLGISKSLFNDKLSMTWNNSVTHNNSSQAGCWIYNSNISCNYRAGNHNNFRLNIYFTGNYNDTGSVNQSFNELKGDITYVFTF
jgi:hypothetical protein